jgi:hypothetical protein
MSQHKDQIVFYLLYCRHTSIVSLLSHNFFKYSKILWRYVQIYKILVTQLYVFNYLYMLQ